MPRTRTGPSLAISLASLIYLTVACSPDHEEGREQVLAKNELSADTVAKSGNCSTIPPDFHSSREFASSRPAQSSDLLNMIRIRADRSITWNGDDVSKSLLEANLRVVPRIYPVPPTVLGFDAGTPCPAINEVRELMRTYLECSKEAVCLQGDGRV